jgi:hypothetical protein
MIADVAEPTVRDLALASASSLCICAVDPGLSGAVTYFFPHYNRIDVQDMPVVAGNVDAATLASDIRTRGPNIAFVEAASSRPGQGVASVFRFGCGFGQVIGVLATLEIPLTLVSASKWKRHFALDSDKEKSRELALRFWPGRSDLFGRKKDHGRSESALLARYGAEKILGSGQ